MAPLTSTEIRAAFSRPIDPVRITAGYRARLAGVLFGLAVLQAVIGSGIKLNFLALSIYAGVPAAGAITTLFLLKPIIVRPPKPPKPRQMPAEEQPVLFEFVDGLCRTLGSPRPSRIFVDLQPNASAAVRGWRGFFPGDLDLTIGLPFATGAISAFEVPE